MSDPGAVTPEPASDTWSFLTVLRAVIGTVYGPSGPSGGSDVREESPAPRDDRPASRQVYDILRLRMRIFRMLDRETLGAVIQLVKAGVEFTAQILYEEIHQSMVPAILKSKTFKQTYCFGVRVLDRSPPPRIRVPASEALLARDKPKPPVRFDAKRLESEISTLRKMFPLLHTILYHYPENSSDDAYVVYLRGDRIIVHLESRVEVDAQAQPWDPPDFPPPPKHPGMDIVHNIAVRLVRADGHKWSQAEMLGAFEGAGYTHYEVNWKSYLYRSPQFQVFSRGSGPTLDKRVVAITHDYPLNTLIFPSLLEIDYFLQYRRQAGYAPLTTVTLSDQKNPPVTVERVRELISSLGPQVRTLNLGKTTLENFPDLQILVDMLDTFLPNLHYLTITYMNDSMYLPNLLSKPLKGLPNLRQFSFRHQGPQAIASPTKLARFVAGLGGKDCVYDNQYCGSLAEREKFTRLVSRVKRESRSA